MSGTPGTYEWAATVDSRRAVHRPSGHTGTIDVLVTKDGDSWAYILEGAVCSAEFGLPTRRAALYASADAYQRLGWRAAA